MIAVSCGVPEFARGLVRDLRVRWALEEAGLSRHPWACPGDPKTQALRSDPQRRRRDPCGTGGASGWPAQARP